jgi:hypothetical protein
MAFTLPAPDDPPPDDGGGGGGTPTPTPPPSGVFGTPIFDLYFNKHEASSILECMAFCNCSSGDDLQFTAYLWVDGQLAQYSSVNMILDNQSSQARFPVTIPMFASGLPAGNRRVQMTIRNLEPQSALTVVGGATIKITELKRAAQ